MIIQIVAVNLLNSRKLISEHDVSPSLVRDIDDFALKMAWLWQKEDPKTIYAINSVEVTQQ